MKVCTLLLCTAQKGAIPEVEAEVEVEVESSRIELELELDGSWLCFRWMKIAITVS